MGNKTIFEWAEMLQEQIQNGASQSDIIQMLEDYKNQALRIHDVVGRSESFVCGHPPKRTYLIDGTWHCEECGWENHEPAPIEFLHGRLMDLFHEWRKTKTENTTVEINGNEFNNLIAKAKTETYAKYPKQKLQEAILKTDM